MPNTSVPVFGQVLAAHVSAPHSQLLWQNGRWPLSITGHDPAATQVAANVPLTGALQHTSPLGQSAWLRHARHDVYWVVMVLYPGVHDATHASEVLTRVAS